LRNPAAWSHYPFRSCNSQWATEVGTASCAGVQTDRHALTIGGCTASLLRPATSFRRKELSRRHRFGRMRRVEQLAEHVGAGKAGGPPSRAAIVRRVTDGAGSRVMTTTVMPRSSLSMQSNRIVSTDWVLSRLPEGRSASSTRGAVTIALAMATRCCRPRDSFAGRRSARSGRRVRCRAQNDDRPLARIADDAASTDGRGAWRDKVFVECLWRSVKYEQVYLRDMP
jgi:hypothetical protein